MTKEQKDGLFQLENGNWGYRIKCKINNKNVDIRKIKDANGNKMPNRQSAKIAKAKHLLQLQEQASSTPIKRYDQTLQDIWDFYVDSNPTEIGRKAPSTFDKHESLWRVHVEPKFGKKLVNEITVEELEIYLHQLYNVDGYSYSYVESFLKLFWLLFGIADRINAMEPGRHSKMFANKGSKLHMPDPHQDTIEKENEIEFYNEQQVAQLNSYFKNRNLEIAFKFALYCGLRISEIFALTWDDYNEYKDTITINKQLAWDTKQKCWYITKPKTRKSNRTITIPRYFSILLKQEKLRQRQLKKDNPILWENNKITLIDRRIPSNLKEISSERFINKGDRGQLLTNNSTKNDAHNIKELFHFNLKFHSLRRTFITQMATKGIDKKVLMDITGHSKFETISKYYYGVQEKSKSDLNETMNTFFNEYK